MLFLLILLFGFAYINITVSERYETDETVIELSDLTENEKREELLQIKKRSEELKSQKEIVSMVVIILIIIFFALFYVVLLRPRWLIKQEVHSN